MSIELAMLARVRAALAHDPALGAGINGVIGAGEPEPTLPFVAVTLVSSIDWGTKDRAGREATLSIAAHAPGATGEGAARIAGVIERVMEEVRGEDAGCAVAAVRLRRAQLRRAKTAWVATLDFRVRAFAPA